MNYRKLERLIRLSGKTKRRIATECGITRPTVDNAMTGADIKVSTLEAIAKCLNVRVGELFDDPPADPSPALEQLREKDRQIAALLDIIGKTQTLPDKGSKNTEL